MARQGEQVTLRWIDVDAVCAWTYAKTDVGEYCITWSWGETGQRLSYPDGTSKLFPDRQAAKVAAEADFLGRAALAKEAGRG